MNEIEELSKLNFKSLPELKPIVHDDLHQKVRKHLYLELGSGPVLYLLSPSYTVINPAPNEMIDDFIRDGRGYDNEFSFVDREVQLHATLELIHAMQQDTKKQKPIKRIGILTGGGPQRQALGVSDKESL